MTGRLLPLHGADPVAHGRQLRSNYVYNAQWTSLDFSDLLSLLWRYDHAVVDGHHGLAGYYRSAWEALIKGIALDETDLGQWLLSAEPPVMGSIPPFVEREAPFAKDLLARAEAVANLFTLREAVLTFGMDEVSVWDPQSPAEGIEDEKLRQAVEDLYFKAFPAHMDKLLPLFVIIDDLLYEMLLAWHPRRQETLANLIALHGFPNPDDYADMFVS